MKMPWFRLYSEVIDDRKLERVRRLSGQPMATVLGVWVTLLALASESPRRGWLLLTETLPLSREEIAAKTGLPARAVGAILEGLLAVGLVSRTESCLMITNWDRRQFSSDSSTPRVQRHRARRRAQASTGSPESAAGSSDKGSDEGGAQPAPAPFLGPECNVSETAPDSDPDPDSDPEPEGEGEGVPPTPAPNGALARVSGRWQAKIGPVNPMTERVLQSWLKVHPPEQIVQAIDQAGGRPDRGLSEVEQALERLDRPGDGEMPAVRACLEAGGRPAGSWWPTIAQTVGQGRADLSLWREVVRAWIGAGWNPANVVGMLDYFRRRELPGAGKGQGYGFSGTYRSPGYRPGQARSQQPAFAY